MERLGEAIARIRPRLRATRDDESAEAEAEPTCHICKDFGFVRKDVPLGDPDFGRAITCSCRHGEVRDRLRRRSQIGALADRSFDNFFPAGRAPLSAQDHHNLAQSPESCRKYADAPPSWLPLFRPP